MSSPAPTTDRPFDDLVDSADPASHNDPASAEQAARRLLEMARSEGDEELELEASVWLCIHLLQQGKLREAIAASHHVRERLRGESPETRAGRARMELLRTIALAASEAGEFEIALGAAQELAGDPAVHADADAAYDAAFALAVCLERMGDSWQALRILTDVVARHGDETPSFPMLYTLNGIVATALGAFHRVRDIDPTGEAVDLLITARDAAERAAQLLERFPNPLYRVAVVGNLGEVLTYQGELDAADTELRTALELAEEIGAAGHCDRVRASIGAWLLAVGRPDEALAWLDRLVDDLGHDGPHSTRIRAHHAAYLAAREIGRFELAIEHHESYERLERQRTTNQLRSQSEMFVTKSEAQAEVDRHRSSAERDPLTGLGNRRHLSRMLHQLAPPDGEATPFSLAMIDVDHFKSINDVLGHAIGDAVLVEMARVLERSTAEDDVVVRYGGEEIVVVMPGTPLADAISQCERVRERVAAHRWPGLPAEHVLTISIGVASAPPSSVERVVGAADRAMYAAKRAGRNRVCAASDDDLRDATPLSMPRH